MRKKYFKILTVFLQNKTKLAISLWNLPSTMSRENPECDEGDEKE